MAFQDYASELSGWIPKIDLLLAQILINRAWRDVRESRLWSWLTGEGTLVIPNIITTGSMTVTQYSAIVVPDAVAGAALHNLANPLLTQRQFRSVGGGPIYNIIAATDNGAIITQLTLDRPWMDATAAGAPYQIYRCYYTPADGTGAFISDFLMFVAILNATDGYAIVGKNLFLTKAELDARDPTRGSQGNPYAVATYKVDALGNPVYELWPHPTVARGLPYLYRRRGLPLSATRDVPSTLSSDLVFQRALDYGCDWAMLNAGRFSELKGIDFQLLKAEANRKYTTMLQDAKRNDDNIFLENFLPNLRDYLNYPPIDSNFLQSHDWGDTGWWES
jgi:hypothetical protein